MEGDDGGINALGWKWSPAIENQLSLSEYSQSWVVLQEVFLYKWNKRRYNRGRNWVGGWLCNTVLAIHIHIFFVYLFHHIYPVAGEWEAFHHITSTWPMSIYFTTYTRWWGVRRRSSQFSNTNLVWRRVFRYSSLSCHINIIAQKVCSEGQQCVQTRTQMNEALDSWELNTDWLRASVTSTQERKASEMSDQALSPDRGGKYLGFV